MTSRGALIVAALLLLLFRPGLHAQNFPMLHYTVEDGLPSNTIYNIYRDSKGFLWVTTDKGVARYNGLRFQTFSTADGLPDNEIFFIQEDRYSRIWFGTFSGELCYYKNDTFHNSVNTPFLRLPVRITHTKHISVESDSSLIITFFGNKTFVTVNRDRCKVFYLDSLHDPALQKSIAFKKRISPNRYELICADRVVIIDTFCRILSQRKIPEKYFNWNGSFSGCQDREFLYNDSCIYDLNINTVRNFPAGFAKQNSIHEVYFTSTKSFYATDNGLFVNDTLHLLKGIPVSSITQDVDSNYWISTLNNGVFCLKVHFLNTAVYDNAYTNQVRSAVAHNGKIFFVTEPGSLWQLNKGQLINLSENRSHIPVYPADPGFSEKAQSVFFTREKGVLLRLDLRTNVAKIVHRDLETTTKAIYVADSCLYLKQSHGIRRIRMDRDGNLDGTSYLGANANKERIFAMAQAPDNTVWYSTINNVYRSSCNDADGILQPQFKGFDFKYFDFFGKYLIGYTQDNSFLICRDYDKAAISVDTIPRQQCVWNRFSRLDDAHVLISTNSLFMLLSVEKVGGRERFTVRPVESPFIPLHTEAFCCNGGNTYFFKDHSITVIDNKTILGIPSPPVLHFSFLHTASALHVITSAMQIPFGESRHLTISFTTQSFGSRDVRYQYSISKGEQDNWRDLTAEEFGFLNSGYGTYTIKVRAKSTSGPYSTPITFTLEVLRPFWATWWFVSAFFIVVALLSGWAIRYRIAFVLRRREKQHQTEIKFMRSEYKALNALMNPHFIFNTLNNVQGLVNRNDKLAANEYIRVFADLIRQNMHNVSKELIPLQKEMDLVSNYLALEKLRFKDHLNYTINVPDSIDLSEILVPPLLVQPLVENSIKHGILPRESTEGLICIDIYERNGILHVDVKDNGVGMGNGKVDDTMKHESFGLKNVRARIEQLGLLLNKQIELLVSEQTDTETGTRWTVVSILIPV